MRSDLFATLDRAAGKAYNTMNKALGIQGDPDVVKYEKLQPNDLQVIQDVYGSDALVEYITAMETKRLKGG